MNKYTLFLFTMEDYMTAIWNQSREIKQTLICIYYYLFSVWMYCDNCVSAVCSAYVFWEPAHTCVCARLCRSQERVGSHLLRGRQVVPCLLAVLPAGPSVFPWEIITGQPTDSLSGFHWESQVVLMTQQAPNQQDYLPTPDHAVYLLRACSATVHLSFISHKVLDTFQWQTGLASANQE